MSFYAGVLWARDRSEHQDYTSNFFRAEEESLPGFNDFQPCGKSVNLSCDGFHKLSRAPDDYDSDNGSGCDSGGDYESGPDY